MLRTMVHFLWTKTDHCHQRLLVFLSFASIKIFAKHCASCRKLHSCTSWERYAYTESGHVQDIIEMWQWYFSYGKNKWSDTFKLKMCMNLRHGWLSCRGVIITERTMILTKNWPMVVLALSKCLTHLSSKKQQFKIKYSHAILIRVVIYLSVSWPNLTTLCMALRECVISWPSASTSPDNLHKI